MSIKRDLLILIIILVVIFFGFGFVLAVIVFIINKFSTSHDKPKCQLKSDYLDPIKLNTGLNNISIKISNIKSTDGKTYDLGIFSTQANYDSIPNAYYSAVDQTIIINKPLSVIDSSILVPPIINILTGTSVTIYADVCATTDIPCKNSDIITYTYKGTIIPKYKFDQSVKSGSFVFDAPIMTLVSVTNCTI